MIKLYRFRATEGTAEYLGAVDNREIVEEVENEVRKLFPNGIPSNRRVLMSFSGNGVYTSVDTDYTDFTGHMFEQVNNYGSEI